MLVYDAAPTFGFGVAVGIGVLVEDSFRLCCPTTVGVLCAAVDVPPMAAIALSRPTHMHSTSRTPQPMPPPMSSLLRFDRGRFGVAGAAGGVVGAYDGMSYGCAGASAPNDAVGGFADASGCGFWLSGVI